MSCRMLQTHVIPFVFLTLCTNPVSLACNHPSPHVVPTTAAGFFFPNLGVLTFLLLLFIAFCEVVVGEYIKQG